MRYVALDVNTANPDLASICQLGIVGCDDAGAIEEWCSYINPNTYFDPLNTAIHRISAEDVETSPSFSDVFPEVRSRLQDSIVVSHTHFTRAALNRACVRNDISVPTFTWLDTARVARRTWETCAWHGYGLSEVCELIGYDCFSHDALAKARSVTYVLSAAIRESGIDIGGLLDRVRRPIDLSNGGLSSHITRKGNPEGPSYGEVVVFTGALSTPRRLAADLAASLGCEVASNVTNATTLLVVGDQDLSRLAGHPKSSKHRKAEELITQGRPIRILKESDFNELVRLSGE